MKKLTAILLVLALVLSLGACGAKPSAASDAGYYKIDSLNDGDQTYDAETLEAFGMGDLYILLNEDGTGYLDLGLGERTALTWEAGKVTADGETLSYTLEDGKLTITDGSTSMTFIRSDGMPPTAAVTEQDNGADSSDVSTGAADPASGELSGDTYTIQSAEEFTDIDGNPAIRFYFDYNNNSNEIRYPYQNIECRAEQAGYELVDTYTSSDEDVPEYGNLFLNVQPGVTIRCIQECAYQPDGGVVSFVLSDYSDGTLTMQFDPENLPGRPEELEMPAITEPVWTAGMEAEGVYADDYYIKIDHYEYAESFTGVPVVCVYFEFTNNSDEEQNFFMATSYMAMQDGVELQTTWANEDIPEEDNRDVDIAPGESIMAAVCFELRSNSPVEVILEDFWNDAYIGLVIPAA